MNRDAHTEAKSKSDLNIEYMTAQYKNINYYFKHLDCYSLVD